ncbi:YobA family protein [Paenibacillus sp. J5C_2022]|uniref:YobA family protein n=1 Tax=Paenibacillus sp. J5C2022 TaxID=2977129 RepID=UPI0021D12667|nr:YobA family protein [Paenibacillus sp. J5C2022]MCU6713057.1 YobA family protein [Paenibacillus sp. J5C2022]
MKKAIVISFIILGLTILFILLESTRGEPNLIGRVVDEDGNRLLVISGITMEEIDGNVIDIINSGKYKGAYWITVKGPNSFKNFNVGDQVRVWFSKYVADSYPAQTEAVKIEKVRE